METGRHRTRTSTITTNPLPTIDLVYFNAGGGHRSAALALEAVIREQARPWAVRLVNLMQILDPQDVFRKTMGMEWEDLYNTRLARDFMQLSDFFIGKPGPGSISEAIQQGLPVIVVNNTWTMPQERYNAEWVSETRTGIVLDSFKDIRAGVDEVIARLPELRARVARIENRAIFEIPEILGRLLHADQFASAHLRDLPRARGLREPYRQTGAPIR